MCVGGGAGVAPVSLPHLIRTAVLSDQGPTLNPNTSLEAPSPNTVRLAVRASSCEFGGG